MLVEIRGVRNINIRAITLSFRWRIINFIRERVSEYPTISLPINFVTREHTEDALTVNISVTING